MLKHVHRKELNNICPKCGKKCLNSQALKLHVKVHPSYKWLTCALCEKRFPNTTLLKWHEKFHCNKLSAMHLPLGRELLIKNRSWEDLMKVVRKEVSEELEVLDGPNSQDEMPEDFDGIDVESEAQNNEIGIRITDDIDILGSTPTKVPPSDVTTSESFCGFSGTIVEPVDSVGNIETIADRIKIVQSYEIIPPLISDCVSEVTDAGAYTDKRRAMTASARFQTAKLSEANTATEVQDKCGSGTTLYNSNTEAILTPSEGYCDVTASITPALQHLGAHSLERASLLKQHFGIDANTAKTERYPPVNNNSSPGGNDVCDSVVEDDIHNQLFKVMSSRRRKLRLHRKRAARLAALCVESDGVVHKSNRLISSQSLGELHTTVDCDSLKKCCNYRTGKPNLLLCSKTNSRTSTHTPTYFAKTDRRPQKQVTNNAGKRSSGQSTKHLLSQGIHVESLPKERTQISQKNKNLARKFQKCGKRTSQEKRQNPKKAVHHCVRSSSNAGGVKRKMKRFKRNFEKGCCRVQKSLENYSIGGEGTLEIGISMEERIKLRRDGIRQVIRLSESTDGCSQKPRHPEVKESFLKETERGSTPQDDCAVTTNVQAKDSEKASEISKTLDEGRVTFQNNETYSPSGLLGNVSCVQVKLRRLELDFEEAADPEFIIKNGSILLKKDRFFSGKSLEDTRKGLLVDSPEDHDSSCCKLRSSIQGLEKETFLKTPGPGDGGIAGIALNGRVKRQINVVRVHENESILPEEGMLLKDQRNFTKNSLKVRNTLEGVEMRQTMIDQLVRSPNSDNAARLKRKQSGQPSEETCQKGQNVSVPNKRNQSGQPSEETCQKGQNASVPNKLKQSGQPSEETCQKGQNAAVPNKRKQSGQPSEETCQKGQNASVPNKRKQSGQPSEETCQKGQNASVPNKLRGNPSSQCNEELEAGISLRERAKRRKGSRDRFIKSSDRNSGIHDKQNASKLKVKECPWRGRKRRLILRKAGAKSPEKRSECDEGAQELRIVSKKRVKTCEQLPQSSNDSNSEINLKDSPLQEELQGPISRKIQEKLREKHLGNSEHVTLRERVKTRRKVLHDAKMLGDYAGTTSKLGSSNLDPKRRAFQDGEGSRESLIGLLESNKNKLRVGVAMAEKMKTRSNNNHRAILPGTKNGIRVNTNNCSLKRHHCSQGGKEALVLPRRIEKSSESSSKLKGVGISLEEREKSRKKGIGQRLKLSRSSNTTRAGSFLSLRSEKLHGNRLRANKDVLKVGVASKERVKSLRNAMCEVVKNSVSRNSFPILSGLKSNVQDNFHGEQESIFLKGQELAEDNEDLSDLGITLEERVKMRRSTMFQYNESQGNNVGIHFKAYSFQPRLKQSKHIFEHTPGSVSQKTSCELSKLTGRAAHHKLVGPRGVRRMPRRFKHRLERSSVQDGGDEPVQGRKGGIVLLNRVKDDTWNGGVESGENEKGSMELKEKENVVNDVDRGQKVALKRRNVTNSKTCKQNSVLNEGISQTQGINKVRKSFKCPRKIKFTGYSEKSSNNKRKQNLSLSDSIPQSVRRRAKLDKNLKIQRDRNATATADPYKSLPKRRCSAQKQGTCVNRNDSKHKNSKILQRYSDKRKSTLSKRDSKPSLSLIKPLSYKHLLPSPCKKCRSKMLSKNCDSRHIKQCSDCHERPFLCVTCGKRFKSKYNLFYHMQTHSVARPYKCPTCNAAFKRKLTMKRHNDRRHNDSEHRKQLFDCHERPFVCARCGMKCKSQSNLNDHMQTHSTARPHKCAKCNFVFKRKSSMIRHHNKHHNK